MPGCFQSNRYTVPFEHDGALLELRIELTPSSFTGIKKLVAQHPRNYGRNQDIENPDHLSRLLAERKRGEDVSLLARFLALSPKAEADYGALRARELHAIAHVRRILLLVNTHGPDIVAQALQEAVELGAYGSDYLPLSGELHLTREPNCSSSKSNHQTVGRVAKGK